MSSARIAEVVTTNTRLVKIANAAVVTVPLLVGALSWLFSLRPFTRFVVGVLLGLLISALFYLVQRYRSKLRLSEASCIAQLIHVSTISFSQKRANSWFSECSGYEKERVNWLNRMLEEIWPALNQIRDFVVYGTLKLIFKPLKEQFPGFGALTISLKEPPIIDFQTKFLGGDLLAIPGVDNTVDNIIVTALTDLLVWPNRLVFPILGGDYSSLMLRPIGKLKVELVEAQDIANADLWGKSDPYAMLYIRRKQGCIWTSSTKMNTNCPIWNEIHTFDVEDLDSQVLTIQLFDFDSISGDDFIGIAQFPLIDIEPDIEQDVWVSIVEDLKKKDDSSIRGKVHIHVSYQPLPEDRTEGFESNDQSINSPLDTQPSDDQSSSHCTIESEKASS
ncbi:hypothetical protein KP509_20G020800 [Ceratopteris richardii]|uniref:C2 domain-containing protein n=1 Tax=Ceratopteris richardii TaxID=49495 RepID=A0A8T2SHH2_CERRI|nr:hypothetical protein KP509_20G020800 [Ceratopteris richardii]